MACNLASRHPERVEHLVISAYAMNAHEEEVGRTLRPMARFMRNGDWSSLWRAFGSPTEGSSR